MSCGKSPKIDYRSETELYKDLTDQIIRHSRAWDQTPGDGALLKSDPFANSIIMSFLRIFQVMQERLNKVPQKHFIAFLDMLAMKMRHPESARTPISFSLTKSARRWTLVPEGVQIASDTPEAPTPVVFETIEDIAVILPRPVKAVSTRPLKDTHTLHNHGLFDVTENTVENFFEGTETLPHRLYLGEPSLGELVPGDSVKIIIELNSAQDVALFLKMQPKLLYFHDELETFVPIPGITFVLYGDLPQDEKDKIDGLGLGVGAGPLTIEEQERFIFAALPVIDPDTQAVTYTSNVTLTRTPAATAIKGHRIDPNADLTVDFAYEPYELEDVWLAIDGVPDPKQIDQVKEGQINIREIKFSYALAGGMTVQTAGMAFTNRAKTDLSLDFFPLGAAPKFNDTFYFGNEELFAREKGDLQVTFDFSPNYPAPMPGINGTPRLIWEFFGENGWKEITWDLVLDVTTTVTNDPATNTDTVVVTHEIWPRGPRGANPVWKSITTTTWGPTLINNVSTLTRTISQEFPYSPNDNVNGNPVPVTGPYVLPKPEEFTTDDITAGLTIGHTYDANGNSIAKPIPILLKLPAEDQVADGQHGIVKFAKTKIHSKENNWLRARLAKGDYGKSVPPRFTMQMTGNTIALDDQGDVIYNLVNTPQEPQPPCLVEVQIAHTPPGAAVIPAHTVSFNNYYYRDLTGLSGYTPFLFFKDHTPTLYVGFNESLSELPVTLFLSLLKQDKVSELYLLNTEPPKVFWEYWDNGWKTLQIDDRTNDMRNRDIVKFRAPEALDKTLLFDEELYWLRARMERDEPSLTIKADGLYNNVAWAHQYVTIDKEVMGSGNGLPGQRVKFKNKPVLTGEKVYVRDDIISDYEINQYRKTHGEDAVIEEFNTFTNKIDTWVRWMPVDHFYFSEKDSRHYYIDRIQGGIIFGNNTNGMIPPKAKNNLLCLHYRYGGGEQGNLGIDTVKKLRTGIPYVEAVVNFLPTFGGEKADDINSLVANAPSTLKSGNRAVTEDDFIFMVKQASGQVARVKCLPATDVSGAFHPGYITLIVLPYSDDTKPVLHNEIIDDIELYLSERMNYNLHEAKPKQVNLVSPKYVKCSVDVIIAEYTDINESLAAENEIKAALTRYFHANRGGTEGTGWPFGRNVPISELVQIAEKSKAVSLISKISVTPSMQQFQFVFKSGIRNPYPKHSLVSLKNFDVQAGLPGEMQFYIPKPILVDNNNPPSNRLTVVGFKEGDQIQVSSPDGSLTTEILVIANVGYDYLEIDRAFLPDLKPGYIVKTLEGRVKSYLLNEIKSGKQAARFEIAVPEKIDKTGFDEIKGRITVSYKNASENVALREVSREITNLALVDSVQYYYVKLEPSFKSHTFVTMDFPKGTPVQIGNKQEIQMLLNADHKGGEAVDKLWCRSFQVGDTVEVADNSAGVLLEATVKDLAGLKVFIENIIILQDIPIDKSQCVLRTKDRLVRFPLDANTPQSAPEPIVNLPFPDPLGLYIQHPKSSYGNQDIVIGDFSETTYVLKEAHLINTGASIVPMRMVYLENNYLTYSGEHTVEQEGI